MQTTQAKPLYSVNRNTGEVRVNYKLFLKRIGLAKGLLYNLAYLKGLDSFGERYVHLADELKKTGISTSTLNNWYEKGILLYEMIAVIKFVADKEGNNTKALALVKLLSNNNHAEVLGTLFYGDIPVEVFQPKANKVVTPNDLKELAISKRLAVALKAAREYPTPSGNIDLLTATQLIEVKSGDNWKHGIGQLIAYGTHHPDKHLVLYLFDYDYLDLENVGMVCNRVNIEVMLHQ